MEEEIGKMAANFVQENITSFFKAGKGVLKGANREIQLRLERSYTSYLEKSGNKYSKTKSFFIRDTQINLYDFYVPIPLKVNTENIENPSFKNLTKLSNRIVIIGTGGCGKSVLMKHLFINSIAEKKKIPVFIELRKLNSNAKTLLELLHSTINSFGDNFDEEYIRKATKLGHFSILLDGFDEILSKRRKKLISEIKKLSRDAEDCTIIISSRPDEIFSGINEFNIFRFGDLSLSTACTLIEKLPFDEKIKKKFLKDLKEDLYEKHQSFLSNPLLLSIMLLTYGQNAQIPNKLSIFYNQAYEALFQRHDALKGGYKRDRLTDLDIQEFSRIFSVFCLQTYDKRIFNFTRTAALDYIEKSKSHLSKSFSNEDYLEDTLKATCLLIEDGLQIFFSHRSFQEYFVAVYINNASPEIQTKLLEKYMQNFRNDSVMNLLFEMNQDLVERILFIPIMGKLFQKLGFKRKIGITHFTKYIKLAYSQFNLEPEINATLKRDYWGIVCETFSIAIDLYKAFHFDSDAINKEELEIQKKYGAKQKYRTISLTHRQPFIRDLMNHNSIFSLKYLKTGYDLFLKLQKKHNDKENSLDRLLDI